MLYHLLCGRPPFLGQKPMEILMAHVSQPPMPLRQRNAAVPASLEELTMWSLAKDREERCPSAGAFRDALRTYLEAEGLDEVDGWADLRTDLTLPEPSAPAQTMLIDRVLASDDEDLPELPLDALVEEPEDTSVGRSFPGISSSAPTEEIDIEALVAEAVAEAAKAPDLHRRHGQDSQMAGLQRGRHSDVVAERAAYMYTRYGITYDSYQGPNPFWVRDHRGELLGPLDLRDTFLVLKKTSELVKIRETLLSADEHRWMGAEAFIRLIGQESLLDSKIAEFSDTDSIWSGTLETISLTALFGRMTRDFMSGRLILERGHDVAAERAEVHVIRGRPTFVHLSEDGYQIPDLLVRQGLLRIDQLASYIHRALREENALEAILAREAGIDVTQWRRAFMRERLQKIMTWRGGSYFFDSRGVPGSLRPFATSLLSMARDLVPRVLSSSELETWAMPLLDEVLKPSDYFAEGVQMLRLTPQQAQLMRKLLKKGTMREGLEPTRTGGGSRSAWST
ncbi:MAG: hypothetical protein HC923_13545 [Myxococcales bacterium]|nr:hypothetical protein [Myxococcales bacterium]